MIQRAAIEVVFIVCVWFKQELAEFYDGHKDMSILEGKETCFEWTSESELQEELQTVQKRCKPPQEAGVK